MRRQVKLFSQPFLRRANQQTYSIESRAEKVTADENFARLLDLHRPCHPFCKTLHYIRDSVESGKAVTGMAVQLCQVKLAMMLS